MPSIVAYHRPRSLDEAATLLASPDRRALGGGTVVVPDARIQRDHGTEVVDLQDLGLDGVEDDGARLTLGAMVRLGTMATDPRVPELLRESAHRELPSALRNQATVGGTVALADADSVLYAALLVSDAQLHLHGSARPLAGGRLARGELVLGVSVAGGGRFAIVGTGRTPADVPIVSAVARNDGETTRLALTGVADTPVEVDVGNPTSTLTPTSDFRGTADYRMHLAAVLSRRALSEVG